ncbi:hypothetical protein TH63_02810 [Rufibacter radiotolerans]|uniref:Glycosyltransferase n=1 Tax=Rufibacter radiotolerans TaxID=1379910 RepID=A0A0H4VM25_9BACT|nr:glycosyltransferase [Rufibacter radiotolerans]AKQ44799.1 hypothetical protein TH63_02810 [Rufibacter radiotolerans]
MTKKNVLCLIGSLGVGGAEVLLVNTIKLLNAKYNFIVVYLNNPDTLLAQLSGVEAINLNFKGKLDIFSSSQRLKKIISDRKVDIVHAHLYWPTLIGRLGTPKKVKFVFTVHSILSQDAFSANKLSLLAEKLTYSQNQVAVFVSNAAREDYRKYVGLKGANYVVNNFIADDFYLPENKRGPEFLPQSLKLVSVGNLKEAKNFPFLLAAFEKLKEYKITLDIYGEGHLRDELQRQINEKGLHNVRLCGSANNVPEILKNYDMFIISSIYEGFALAPLEAMAVGLPCMLSDIPSLHEVAGTSALFFDLKDDTEFNEKVLEVYNNPERLAFLSKEGYEKAKKYRKVVFEEALSNVYNNCFL